MGTGAVFANFSNKKIAGYNDFGLRMLSYLKELNRESIQSRFDVDGVFNTKLGLAGGVDTVTVTGSSRATDGIGHTILAASTGFGVSALFENANTVVYHVGLRFCEIPVSVEVNPRTGLPEYASFKEEIGESGVPNAVVNNGTTLTFTVNSVTESGVSNAGRTVRVYKLLPAPGATTEAIAIEDRPVVWDGSNNKITTTGLLGQSAVSTTAADYVVVMMGVTVKRNTNLETSPNHCFVGTVTGVGAGGTPSVFSTSLQRLLSTLGDAAQVVFTPYSWITHTNVQQALQDVVDILGDASGTPGASRVGTDPTAFSAAKPAVFADGAGGIGNVADGTFTTPKHIQIALLKVDAALNRHRGWTKTFGGGRGAALGNTANSVLRDGGIGDVAWNGGAWFLQGTSAYTLVASTHMNANAGPYVLGEVSGPSNGGGRTQIRLDSNTNVDEPFYGKWQRVDIDQDGSLTGSLETNGGLKLHHCLVASGILKHRDLSNAASPVQAEATVFGDGINHRSLPGTLTLVSATAGSALWGNYNGCLFRSANGASAVLWILHTTQAGVVLDDLVQRKVKFTNCNFVAGHNHPVLSDTGTTDDPIVELVFESCNFKSNDSFLTSAAFITLLRTKRVTFRDCNFHDRGGNGIFLDSAIIEGCRFFVGKTSQVTNRKRLELSSCNISKSEVTIYDVGSTNTNAIDIVAGTVNGLKINFDAAGDDLGSSQAVKISQNCQVSNLTISFNGGLNGTGGSANALLMDSSVGTNIRLAGVPAGRSSANSSGDYVRFTFCALTNIKLAISGSTLSNSYNSTCAFSQCEVQNFKPTTSAIPKVPSASGPFRIESGTHIDAWRMGTGPWRANSSGTAGIVLAFGKNRVSKVDYSEGTGASGDAMILSTGDYNTIKDCMFIGGARDGLFGGNVVRTDGDFDQIMDNTIEWSPSSNAAGFFAVKTTGDFPSVNDNTFIKDTTGTDFTDIHFEHSGTGNNDLDNNIAFTP